MKIIVYECDRRVCLSMSVRGFVVCILNSKRPSNYCGFIMITYIYRVEERTQSFWTRVKHNGRYYVRYRFEYSRPEDTPKLVILSQAVMIFSGVE